MAGNDDRQPVVAAGLAHGARFETEALREFAIRLRAAAGNRAKRFP
jgi:predicted dienelactone hydrolase